ncbi:hypothetical protein [Agaribacter marinus]|uniref:Uncharacterized protein n=1 Tax=Agaribacter marinus TaxID=1431249 RepID=A0AA37SVV1_9ALTE|nr:hypothetical protein [Agaribacter marinus]GLR70513.1 hypothetical protein GCM10007852_14210 [Agaribacter marinus]
MNKPFLVPLVAFSAILLEEPLVQHIEVAASESPDTGLIALVSKSQCSHLFPFSATFLETFMTDANMDMF